jgi:hypothetical protein
VLLAPTLGEADEAAIPAEQVEDALVAPHPSVEMTLVDGSVSLIEYQAAALRVAVCDDSEGGFKPTVEFEEDSGGFSFTFPAGDDNDEVHNACRLQYLDDVEIAFASQERLDPEEARNRLDAYEECLRSAGRTPESTAIDSLEDQSDQGLGSSCIA